MEKNGEQMFDMADDPCEMRNIINDPEYYYILNDLRYKLLVYCNETSNALMKTDIKPKLELSFK